MVRKDRLELGNSGKEFLMLLLQLLSLQTCQRTQTHVYDRLGLNVIETEALSQSVLGLLDIGALADDLDNFIDVVESDQ